VAADLALPRLRERADPAAVREIRIWWITGGFMIPEVMTRIVELEDGAVGHQYVFWPRQESDGKAGAAAPRVHGMLDAAGWRARVDDPSCRATRSGVEFMTCERRSGQRMDWAKVLRLLDSLDVERAPRPPGCPPGVDGWTIFVEIRQGANYVHYDCWAPTGEDANAEVRRIARIAGVAWRGPER
jgi:hypothetical protein